MIRCTRKSSWLRDPARSPAGAGGRAAIIGFAVVFSVLFASSAPAATTAQVGFSPEGTARVLVLDVINSAQHEIRMLAYSFTAPDIAQALVAAKQRGVDVRVVLDAGESRSRAAVAAANLLVNAGIPVRVDSYYKIQHDKVIVADGRNVQTGSFNYSSAGEHANSENAVVIWDYPAFAKPFLDHFESRWSKSAVFRSTY